MIKEAVWVLTSLLAIVAGWMDLRYRRIPNWLNVLMLLSGVAGSFLPGRIASPGQAMLGMLVGFAIPFVLFAMGALGGGASKAQARSDRVQLHRAHDRRLDGGATQRAWGERVRVHDDG